jgi:MSHA pilin protein MshA
MNKLKGFTLIELVVVMVILGILAAFAIPKFYDFSSQANIADINGLAGALNSASTTAHGAAIALGYTTTASGNNITMEGQTVNLVYGYPDSATPGIDNAVSVSSTFTVTPGSPATFILKPNCLVTYTKATSASAPATIVTTTSGC